MPEFVFADEYMTGSVSHPLESLKYFSWASAKVFLMGVALTDWNSLGTSLFCKRYFTREIGLAQNSPFSSASHLHLHFTQVPRVASWSNSHSVIMAACSPSLSLAEKGIEEHVDSLNHRPLTTLYAEGKQRSKWLHWKNLIFQGYSMLCVNRNTRRRHREETSNS